MRIYSLESNEINELINIFKDIDFKNYLINECTTITDFNYAFLNKYFDILSNYFRDNSPMIYKINLCISALTDNNSAYQDITFDNDLEKILLKIIYENRPIYETCSGFETNEIIIDNIFYDLCVYEYYDLLDYLLKYFIIGEGYLQEIIHDLLSKGDYEIIRILLNNGATDLDYMFDLLNDAFFSNDDNVVDTLIKSGVDIDYAMDDQTLLCKMIDSYYEEGDDVTLEIIEKLIFYGADITKYYENKTDILELFEGRSSYERVLNMIEEQS